MNLLVLNPEFIGYSKFLVGCHIGFIIGIDVSYRTAIKGPFTGNFPMWNIISQASRHGARWHEFRSSDLKHT